MKPIPSAIVDLITILVLYAYLALYMVGFFAPTPDFVASHGPTMWCAFAAVVCFLYAFVQAGERSPLRILLLSVRVLLCLGVALFIDLFVYVRWYRPDDGEWQAGAYLLSFLALVSGVPAFVVGYVARILRDRLTMRRSEPLTGPKIHFR